MNLEEAQDVLTVQIFDNATQCLFKIVGEENAFLGILREISPTGEYIRIEGKSYLSMSISQWMPTYKVCIVDVLQREKISLGSMLQECGLSIESKY